MTTLRRVVRRNKGLVAAAAGLVALLILSVLVGLFALVQKNEALDARATALQVQNDLLEEQAQKREMVGGLINFFMEDSFREISKLANSQEARESLVGVSLEYLERLRAEAGDDPSVKRMLADGLVLAGRNQWSLTSGNRGDLDGAMTNYIEGVALADELYASGDQQARNTALQGRLLLLQGYRRLGDTDAMRRMVSESELMVSAVDDPLANLEFARLVFELRLQAMRLRPKDSELETEPSVLALVEVAEELGERHVNPAVARDTTLAWNALGQAWSESGDHAKALEFYERSVEARREIAQAADATNTSQRDLLNAYRYAATQRGRLGQMEDVISDYQLHIVPLARMLVADNPEDSRTREDLALALMEYGSYQAYSQDQDQRSNAVAPLSEARIVWSEYLKNRADDATRDLTTTRRLLQCEAALALAYLAADAVPSARGAVDRGETIISSARKSWPDDRRLQSRIDELLRVRALVLEEQGRLDRP